MKRPLEKTAQKQLDAEVKAYEERIQQRFQAMDRAHTERLCQRYQHLVPAERIQRVKDHPTIFEDHESFEKSRLAARVAEPADGRKVVGYYPGNFESAHVDMDSPQAEKAAVHERIHELSDSRAEQRLGKQLNEGITEDLAMKEMGRELPSGYSSERIQAQELRRVCGDDAVDRAYFGETRDLRTCMDNRLGKESLAKLENDLNTTPGRDNAETDKGE